MDKNEVSLTVFFEEPFWVGVFERTEGASLSVCKVTFGAEPKDCAVWSYILKEYTKLAFSPSVQAAVKKQASNPKRVLREVRRQAEQHGIGTKSQQALQLQREAGKAARKTTAHAAREAEREQRFFQKQQKRKQKHRGR